MTGIPHILSFYSAPWIPWLMLLSLMMMVICIYVHPQLIQDCFYSYVSNNERAFSQHGIKWIEWAPNVVYKILILSFILYAWVGTMGNGSITSFALLCLLVIGYLLIRKLVYAVAYYVFNLQQTKLPHVSSFDQLGLVLCLSLFPVAIMAMYTGATPTFQIATLLLFGIYILLFIIKAAIAFRGEVLSFILFLIYLITVVLLPAGGAVVVAQYIQ